MSLLLSITLLLVKGSLQSDAKTLLADARDFRSKQMAAANATRINAEITKAQQTVIAKARDLLKDTKVDAIAPQEGNDYSQLYAMAAMYREALIAVEKYITIASGDEKFSVQLSAAQFASELKDPAKIVEHLSAIEPLKSQQALSLAVSRIVINDKQSISP